MRRPKLDSGASADDDGGDDTSPESAEDSTRGGGGGGGGRSRFEGGTGGRARGGEWQVELAPTASRDPREPNRGRQGAAAADANPFADMGRTSIDEAPEEYPALIGSGTSSVLGWGRLSGRSQKGAQEEFPALGGGSASSGKAAGGAGGLSAASLVAAGRDAGSSSVDAGLWNARIKTDKRLKARGGISKASAPLNFKDATEPPLPIAVRLHL